MSRSPLDERQTVTDDFRRSQQSLQEMIRAGKSWSGNERNCCFLNTGSQRFATISAVSGLDYIDDARAAATVDWDFDGDLDVWLVNRTAPQVRFARNELSNGHHFVAIELEGTTSNRDAIGARVNVFVEDPGGQQQKLIKTVRAGDGFLSQSSKTLHFGLGKASRIRRVVVHWPGAATETIQGIEVDGHYHVVQGSGRGELWEAPSGAGNIVATDIELPESTGQAEVLLGFRLPLAPLWFTDRDGRTRSQVDIPGKKLITLWSASCPACLKELRHFGSQESKFRAAGIRVTALALDHLRDGKKDWKQLEETLARLGCSFDCGLAHAETLQTLELLRSTLWSRRQPFPTPTSLLVDRQNNLIAVYVGPISVDRVIGDAKKMHLADDELLADSLPFDGRWHLTPKGVLLSPFADYFASQGMPRVASFYRKQAIREYADKYNNQGLVLAQRGKPARAIQHFHQALSIAPDHVKAHHNLGTALISLGRVREGMSQLRKGLQFEPADAELNYTLGLLLTRLGKLNEAERHFRRAVNSDPDDVLARANLGDVMMAGGKAQRAVQHYREALNLRPEWSGLAMKLAWYLASSDDPSVRNGSEAVELAERVVDLPGKRTPQNLDVLAAAYAEAGRFEDAERIAREAIDAAEKVRQPGLAKPMRARLGLYEKGQTFRQGKVR